MTSTDRPRCASLILVTLALGSCVLCGSSRGSEPLWGNANLLSGPRLKAGDILEVILCDREAGRDAAETDCGDAGADADARRCEDGSRRDLHAPRHAPLRSPPHSALRALSARIVKVLPNGNLVLEASIRLGKGAILLGGEAARLDVSVERTVKLSRLSGLMVVARDVAPDLLAGMLRSAGAVRLADGRGATAQKPER